LNRCHKEIGLPEHIGNILVAEETPESVEGRTVRNRALAPQTGVFLMCAGERFLRQRIEIVCMASVPHHSEV
jgi:hypothetical protein